MPSIRLVLTTLPNAEIAGTMARNLVDSGLAACVNILAPCRSVYRWQGVVQEDGEIPLFIKTTAELYPALETFLRKRHPYELPEIVALDVVAGLPEYLQWVVQSTSIRSADSVPDAAVTQS